LAAGSPSVTVIVPCLNEEAGLPALLARLGAMRRNPQRADWRFLFVDDGSTDGSFAALLRATRDQNWIEVSRHHETLGLGAALRTGFVAATSPIICTIDADCTYPPERLPELIAPLAHGAAVVTAARPPTGNGLDRQPSATAFGGAGASIYGRLIGQDVSALSCPLRAYNRDVIQRIRFRANGFSAVGEILLRAMLAGHTVHVVPMRGEHRSNGESKLPAADRLLAHAHLISLATLALTARRVRPVLSRRSA
jgi:glycosyltransferase involved in cell wall biosynthesis